MDYIKRDYKVTNALMGPDFHLTALGAQMLAQDCFAALMARYHVAAFDLRLRSLMWIISEFSMQFQGDMPYWGETVSVELRVTERPAVKVYVDYRITHKGNIFCKGDSVWAILDAGTRRPVVASGILSGMDFDDGPAGEKHRHRLPPAGASLFSHTHNTCLSDTDFNTHISNITYMRLCGNAMPPEYRSDHIVSSISILFTHESFLGQKLKCDVSATDRPDSWLYIITDTDGTVCSRALISYATVPQCTLNLDCLEIRKN